MKPGQKGFLYKVWYTVIMTPYKRMPRRHFTDLQFNPYFKSHAFLEKQESIDKKNKEDLKSVLNFFKKIWFKK